MIVAISQPEHFPYLGYFQKMAASEIFVFLDDVQFSGPRSFQNRNCYDNSCGKSQWFTVPVRKGSYFSALKDVKVAENYRWRERIVRQLKYRFGFSLDSVYVGDLLCEINLKSIELARAVLGIKTPVVLSSSLGCTGNKSERLANICRAVGGTTYLCGPGGAAYIDSAAFGEINVKLFKPNVNNNETVLVNLDRKLVCRFFGG